MDCPKCGYAMDAFDIECPRCIRYGRQPVRSTPVAKSPVTRLDPLVVQPNMFAQETGDGDSQLALILKFKPGAEAKVRYVPQNVEKVLQAIDGRRSINEVLKLSQIKSAQAAQIIKELIRHGILEALDPEQARQDMLDVIPVVIPLAGQQDKIIACPNCGSEEWKMASLVWKEGTQSLNANSLGVGISGHDVGIGGAQTTGTLQSNIAKEAAPPKAPFSLSGCLMFISFSSLLGFISYLLYKPDECLQFLFGAVVALVVAIIASKTDAEAAEAHAKAIERYNRLRMCVRCGNFYIP